MIQWMMETQMIQRPSVMIHLSMLRHHGRNERRILQNELR
jgi:hypothetical protein